MSIALVNNGGNFSTGSGSVTVSKTGTVGNIVVFAAGASVITPPLDATYFSGSTGVGTITLILQKSAGAGTQVAIFWCKITSANYSIVFSNNAVFETLAVAEFSGANNTSPVDLKTSNTGTTANATTGSLTVPANEMLIHAVMGQSRAYTKPAAYTEIYKQSNTSDLTGEMCCYLNSGAHNEAWTNSADNWASVAITIKPAASTEVYQDAWGNMLDHPAHLFPKTELIPY